MSLEGKRVVVTRAVPQAESLSRLLGEKGAIPLLYPCIAIVPRPLELESRDYDWLVITSSNTAFALRGHDFSQVKIAVVGDASAEAIHKYLGQKPSFIAESHTAEALGQSLPIQQGERLLLPQSALAKDKLCDILRGRGATVDCPIAYDNFIGEGGEDIPQMLGEIDAISFTSGSTVKNFVERIQPKTAFHIPAVVIGDSTAATAQVYGFQTIVPNAFTIEAMVEALGQYFSDRDGSNNL
jgi:uroporphyrinogen-III synthase